MNRFLPHLASRIFNTPLLIAPSKLDAIIAGLGDRLGVAGHDNPVELFTAARGDYRRPGYRVVGNVGVIDIFGVLAHRGGIQADSSYVLGYQEVARQLDAALADAEVSSILLNVDSPGGESAGAFDLADSIRAADAIKPVHAIAGDMALSAGYLIASAARQVAVTRTGLAGSIGVVMRHIDASAYMAKEGVKVTHIFAGAHKVDGNQFEPLSPKVHADFQASVDALYRDFIDQVAASRKMDAQSVIDTQARVFSGKDAVAAGLADLVSTPDAMIRALQEGADRQRSFMRPAHHTHRSQDMHPESSAGAQEVSQELIDEAHAAGFSAGVAEGIRLGAEQERERIRSVEDQSMPGHESLIAAMKYDGETTGPEAAVAVLRAEREKSASALANFRADAPAPVSHAAAPLAEASDGQGAASDEDRAKSEWDSSAQLRAEFGESFGRYMGYLSAKKRGLVKVYQGGKQ